MKTTRIQRSHSLKPSLKLCSLSLRARYTWGDFFKTPMRYRSQLSTLTLIALLLLVIGTGNVFMGYRKGVYFEEAAQALAQKQSENGVKDPLLLERLESKRYFYRIVSQGGIGMLCCAALILGFDVVRRRRP